MGHKQRDKHQRELDRVTVQELLIKGWTQLEIANYMDLSRSTIFHDIQVVQKRTLESQIKGRKKVLALRAMQIDRVMRKAWEAYEKSQEDSITLVMKEGSDGKSLTETVKGQCGDAALLTKVLDAIEMQCKLAGLFAPLKVAETDASGNDLDPETLDERRSRVIKTLGALGFFGAIGGVGSGDQCDAGYSAELPTNT
jgi:hypothetical protein